MLLCITISRHIENPGIVRTVCSDNVRHIQGHSAIFSCVQPYQGTLRHIQTYSGITEAYGTIIRYIRNSAEEASSALFENQKRCSDFGNKSLDCFNLWIRFSIQNVVLRVSRKKNPKCFPGGSLFLVFLICFLVFFCAFDMFWKCLSKCPSFTNHTPTIPHSLPSNILFFFLQNAPS